MTQAQPDATPADAPQGARAPVRAGSIVLARHGRPAINRDIQIDWREYRAWWAQYEASGLDPGQEAPEALLAAAKGAHVFYASTMPRAIETAAAVAGGMPVRQDPIFIEAPLPPPRIIGKRSPSAWGVWSRIAWWLGDHKEFETRKAAELRAQAAVATLTAHALRGENVVLCAHGWFNRMMRPVLMRQGWACVYDGGDEFWSFRRYEFRR